MPASMGETQDEIGTKGVKIHPDALSITTKSNLSRTTGADVAATSSQVELSQSTSSTTFQGQKRQEGASERKSSIQMEDAQQKHSNTKTTENKSSGKDLSDPIEPKRIEDQMNSAHLRQLEEIFKEGSGEQKGLDVEQFRIAMKKTVGNNIDDEELKMIFMKVDTNCDGTVDWDEYLSYMLLEYQERKNMFTLDQDCPFPNRIKYQPSNHLESICSIKLLQVYSTRHNVYSINDYDDAASRYVTLSREGMLNIWNLEWELQKSAVLNGTKTGASGKPLFVTDMVCMANCNTIAVASTDCEISFYSITSNTIKKKFQIIDLKHCALTMDYSFDHKEPKYAILLWGDTSGRITILRFYNNPNLSLFSAPMCPTNKIALLRIIRGGIAEVTASKFKIHRDWVQQVRYYVSRKGQECFISGCIKDDPALFFADITEKKGGTPKQKLTVNRKSHFYIRKGVLCLSYDTEWNLIVTGSRDCNVRVWNPYVVTKSSAVLIGHNTAVQEVLIRAFDHQIISISKDKNVRVWDLRDYSCKQSIPGRIIGLGRFYITAAYFNERLKELVVATNKIGVLQPGNLVTTSKKQKQSQNNLKPVVRVLYNPVFNQIVTGGEDSLICIWDIKTGMKQMQFCAGDDLEITCMTFDPTNRRLLTGGRNGNAILWNFNNGAKLRRLDKMDDQEITDVVFTKQRIVTAGWNRHVRVYIDSYGDDSYQLLRHKHNDDILSLDFHRQDSFLATSAYDGDVYIWSIKSGEVLMIFNMFVSLLPIHFSKHLERNRHRMANIKTENSETGHQERPSATTFKDQMYYQEDWLPRNMPWLSPKRVPYQSALDIDELISEAFQETWSRTPSRASKTSTQSGRSDDNHVVDSTDRAVYKILFLQTRRCDEAVGNLLTSSARGWISTWSVHPTGGMRGYFHACKQRYNDDFVTTMTTDCENKLLITGDSRGYIRTWAISDYCNSDDFNQRSVSSSMTEINSANSREQVVHYLPNSIAPEMTMSVRGHVQSVTSLAYVDDHGLIASGGIDGTIRLWTDEGRYIGTFGQQNPWNIDFPVKVKDLPISIPSDVRQVASTTTLRTAKGSIYVKWKQMRDSVNFAALSGRMGEYESEKKLNKANPIDEGEQRKTRQSPVQERPNGLKHQSRQVEETYARIQNEGLKSSILGKSNYKPKSRRKKASIDPSIKWCNRQAMIYNSLPYAQIPAPVQMPVPEHLRNKAAMKQALNWTHKKLLAANAFNQDSFDADEKSQKRLPPIKATGHSPNLFGRKVIRHTVQNRRRKVPSLVGPLPSIAS